MNGAVSLQFFLHDFVLISFTFITIPTMSKGITANMKNLITFIFIMTLLL
jgi:hypothetical protein